MDSERISGTAQDVKGQVKEGVGNLTGDTKTQAEGYVDQLSGTAKRTIGQARDTLRDASGQLQDQAASIGDFIDETVHERPFTALLAAGAIGYVLSLLIHRR